MEIRILRMKQLTEKLKRSKSQIYADIKAGKFPRGIRLGGPGGRSRGWIESEVDQHINNLDPA